MYVRISTIHAYIKNIWLNRSSLLFNRSISPTFQNTCVILEFLSISLRHVYIFSAIFALFAVIDYVRRTVDTVFTSVVFKT